MNSQKIKTKINNGKWLAINILKMKTFAIILRRHHCLEDIIKYKIIEMKLISHKSEARAIFNHSKWIYFCILTIIALFCKLS